MKKGLGLKSTNIKDKEVTYNAIAIRPTQSIREMELLTKTSTCHLPLQGLSHQPPVTDLPHTLKGVQGRNQK